MAQVALFTEAPQGWIQFDEDTEVLIEYLDRPAAIELNKAVDKIVARTGGDQQIIWGRELGKKAVHGWRNIDQEHNPGHPGFVLPDKEKTPIQFNDANRDLMMKGCREFSIFVNGNAIDAGVFLEINKKNQEKQVAKND
jgi:hypothetical protein